MIFRTAASPGWARSPYDRFVKPAFDRVVGVVLAVLFLPVMLMIAIALLVLLDRPILFRQRRVGRDGHTFDMFKFRTMQPCRRRSQQPVPKEADRRRHHKTAADPRHTPVGRFLRRYSLDELPQLWNVVRGDMSLVGPRPELEQVVATYAPWQHERHRCKPGVTGLWQVTERGRSDGDMHQYTEIDLAYLQRMSLRTDLKILLRTLPAALGRGS